MEPLHQMTPDLTSQELKIPIIDSEKYHQPQLSSMKLSNEYICLADIDDDASFIKSRGSSDTEQHRCFDYKCKRLRLPHTFQSDVLENEFSRCYQHHYLPFIYIYIISYFILNISTYFSYDHEFISDFHTISDVRNVRVLLSIFLILFGTLVCCKICAFRQRTMIVFSIIISLSELAICALIAMPDHSYTNFMFLLIFIHLFSGIYAISCCIISWSVTFAFTAITCITIIYQQEHDWVLFYTSVPLLFITTLCLSIFSIYIESNARYRFYQQMKLRVQKRICKQSLCILLPLDVAKWLLMGRRMALKFKYTLNDPKQHGVSVMFCEICNFDQLVTRLSPKNLIATLNKIFTKWDDYVQLHKLFKLKTINEVYIAAGGLPYPVQQRNDPYHCVRMVFCANDLMYYCNDILTAIYPMVEEEEKHCRSPSKRREALEIRIGLNVGPIVAGVIGKKLPRYDLFGDTMNVAARMKSTCNPSEIQMTKTFYDALPQAFHAYLKRKDNVQVKGKGEMTTFLLDYIDRNRPIDVPLKKSGTRHCRQMPMIPSRTSVEFEMSDSENDDELWFGLSGVEHGDIVSKQKGVKRVRSITATQEPVSTNIGPTVFDVLSAQIDLDVCSDFDMFSPHCTELDSLLQHDGYNRIYS